MLCRCHCLHPCTNAVSICEVVKNDRAPQIEAARVNPCGASRNATALPYPTYLDII
jgi:hypothetical protein